MSLAVLILGIASIVCSGSGILGLLRANKALAADGEDKFARAGKVCSIIGIINGALVLLVLVAVFVANALKSGR